MLGALHRLLGRSIKATVCFWSGDMWARREPRATKMQQIVSFEELVARWVLGDLPPEDVPAEAIAALANGCEAPEVAVLAGLDRPLRRHVEDELVPLLRRLRVARPSRLAALKTAVDACADRIVNGGIPPSTGAHKLWRWANDFWGEGDIFEQLAIFVGLASEWDDNPNLRAGFEVDIVEHAQALLDAGGLRLA